MLCLLFMMRRRHVGRSARTWIVLSALALASPLPVTAGEPCTKAAAQIADSVDRRATEEIERRIASDATVSPLAQRVKVTTSEGVVTLRGVVGGDEDRLVLASLAESAPGVRRVEDQLELQR